MNWQPIGTVPKDGTRVLIVDREGNIDLCAYVSEVYERQEFVRHAKDGDVYRTVREEFGYWQSETVFDPTHWMPLPPPPEAT